jgi:hypothetical protein
MPRQLAREIFAIKPVAGAFLVGAFLLHLLVSSLIEPGTLSLLVSTIALLFCTLTAAARLNDIAASSPRWQIRRIGMVAIVGGCAYVLYHDWTSGTPIEWHVVLLRTGFALSMGTTPNQKPWWRFMGEPDQRSEPRSTEPQL